MEASGLEKQYLKNMKIIGGIDDMLSIGERSGVDEIIKDNALDNYKQKKRILKNKNVYFTEKDKNPELDEKELEEIEEDFEKNSNFTKSSDSEVGFAYQPIQPQSEFTMKNKEWEEFREELQQKIEDSIKDQEIHDLPDIEVLMLQQKAIFPELYEYEKYYYENIDLDALYAQVQAIQQYEDEKQYFFNEKLKYKDMNQEMIKYLKLKLDIYKQHPLYDSIRIKTTKDNISLKRGQKLKIENQYEKEKGFKLYFYLIEKAPEQTKSIIINYSLYNSKLKKFIPQSGKSLKKQFSIYNSEYLLEINQELKNVEQNPDICIFFEVNFLDFQKKNFLTLWTLTEIFTPLGQFFDGLYKLPLYKTQYNINQLFNFKKIERFSLINLFIQVKNNYQGKYQLKNEKYLSMYTMPMLHAQHMHKFYVEDNVEKEKPKIIENLLKKQQENEDLLKQNVKINPKFLKKKNFNIYDQEKLIQKQKIKDQKVKGFQNKIPDIRQLKKIKVLEDNVFVKFCICEIIQEQFDFEDFKVFVGLKYFNTNVQKYYPFKDKEKNVILKEAFYNEISQKYEVVIEFENDSLFINKVNFILKEFKVIVAIYSRNQEIFQGGLAFPMKFKLEDFQMENQDERDIFKIIKVKPYKIKSNTFFKDQYPSQNIVVVSWENQIKNQQQNQNNINNISIRDQFKIKNAASSQVMFNLKGSSKQIKFQIQQKRFLRLELLEIKNKTEQKKIFPKFSMLKVYLRNQIKQPLYTQDLKNGQNQNYNEDGSQIQEVEQPLNIIDDDENVNKFNNKSHFRLNLQNVFNFPFSWFEAQRIGKERNQEIILIINFHDEEKVYTEFGWKIYDGTQFNLGEFTEVFYYDELKLRFKVEFHELQTKLFIDESFIVQEQEIEKYQKENPKNQIKQLRIEFQQNVDVKIKLVNHIGQQILDEEFYEPLLIREYVQEKEIIVFFDDFLLKEFFKNYKCDLSLIIAFMDQEGNLVNWINHQISSNGVIEEEEFFEAQFQQLPVQQYPYFNEIYLYNSQQIEKENQIQFMQYYN